MKISTFKTGSVGSGSDIPNPGALFDLQFLGSTFQKWGTLVTGPEHGNCGI